MDTSFVADSFAKLKMRMDPSIATSMASMGSGFKRRGESIGFVGGPYIGKTGWIDNTGNVTANSIGVIVHNVKKPDGRICDISAMVRKKSIRRLSEQPEKPASYAHAIMEQHPKIEETLKKLCRQLAKCDLDPSSAEIHLILSERLQDAVAEQTMKGQDAEWKRVNYNSGT